MISFIFNAATSIIKYSIGTTIVIGGIAVFSKPEDYTFKPFVENFLSHKVNSSKIQSQGATGIFEYFAKKAFVSGVSAISYKHIDDFVFLKVGTVGFGNDKIKFVGAFKNWYPLQ